MPSSIGRVARFLAIVAAVVLVLVVLAEIGGRDRRGPGASGEPALVSPMAGRTGGPTTATSPSSPVGSPLSSSRTPVGAAVLVGAGDIAACSSSGDEATADVLDTIEGTVFTLGDNVYPTGTKDNFTNCYAHTWGRQDIKERTRPTAGGNEYRVPGAAGYFGYFGEAAGDQATGYYAYEEGAWRVYVLNSACREIGGCAAGSPQELWLREDLAAHATACVLAMWHVPVFSSGHGGDIGLMLVAMNLELQERIISLEDRVVKLEGRRR